MKLKNLQEVRYDHGWTFKKVLDRFFVLQEMRYDVNGNENPHYEIKDGFSIVYKNAANSRKFHVRMLQGWTTADGEKQVLFTTFGGQNHVKNVDRFLALIEIYKLERIK